MVDGVAADVQSLCQPAQSGVTSARDPTIEDIKIKYLEEIIKQKDLII